GNNGGGNFATNNASLALNGSATDTVSPLTLVEWKIGAGGYVAASTSNGWALWNAPLTLSAGANVITVRATDQSGRQGTATITVTLDTTNPTVQITTPTTNPTQLTNIAPLATLAGNSSDASGIAFVRWRRNNGAWTEIAGPGTTPYAWSFTNVPIFAGDNVLEVQVQDRSEERR